MKNEIHSLTLTCTADSPKVLVGMLREVLDQLEGDFNEGGIPESGVMQGGGPNGIVQGFYNAPADFKFGSREVDNPNLPPVEIEEDDDEFSEELPQEVQDFLGALKQMFPDAEIQVTKNETE